MAIHYIDEQGRKGTFADRQALAKALQRGLVSGATRLYVPARKGYLPLAELFDLERLRRGDLQRRGAASSGAQRPPLSSRRRAVAVGGAVAALAAASTLAYLALEHQREAIHRQQTAAELAAVAEEMRRTMSSSPAASAPVAAPAAAPSPAPASAAATPQAPVTARGSAAQFLAEHLAEVRRLSDGYQQALRAVGDGLMTPQSLATPGGRQANRDKLQRARQATDGFFTQMKQAKQRLRQEAETREGPSPERDRNIGAVLAYLDRARAANLQLYDDMLAMNEFAGLHPPTLEGESLLFDTEDALAKWSTLTATLERDQAQLRQVQAEGQKIEQQGLAELQQQIARLKKGG